MELLKCGNDQDSSTLRSLLDLECGMKKGFLRLISEFLKCSI